MEQLKNAQKKAGSLGTGSIQYLYLIGGNQQYAYYKLGVNNKHNDRPPGVVKSSEKN
ncbi:hypothetical protein [Pseudoalteromonas rubra]|uniref:hypothetical protein n=1 Tax=Pseudoalteromonas rubra TaxID=43658 RepID=UPI000A4C0EC8|nr:hypothetical protein [Pseudoalteromonas rubra]